LPSSVAVGDASASIESARRTYFLGSKDWLGDKDYVPAFEKLRRRGFGVDVVFETLRNASSRMSSGIPYR
jgi:hypothetical protein